MIILDFLVDENGLREDIDANPASEELAVLQQTFFVFPTRFRINESEMFSYSKSRLVMDGGQTGSDLEVMDQIMEEIWLPLPLLHLALIGIEKVREACKGEEVSYSLAGSGVKLIFVPAQGKLDVHSTLNGKVERVECQELIEAFINFKEKTLFFLKNRVPDIEQHPELQKVIKV